MQVDVCGTEDYLRLKPKRTFHNPVIRGIPPRPQKPKPATTLGIDSHTAHRQAYASVHAMQVSAGVEVEHIIGIDQVRCNPANPFGKAKNRNLHYAPIATLQQKSPVTVDAFKRMIRSPIRAETSPGIGAAITCGIQPVKRDNTAFLVNPSSHQPVPQCLRGLQRDLITESHLTPEHRNYLGRYYTISLPWRLAQSIVKLHRYLLYDVPGWVVPLWTSGSHASGHQKLIKPFPAMVRQVANSEAGLQGTLAIIQSRIGLTVTGIKESDPSKMKQATFDLLFQILEFLVQLRILGNGRLDEGADVHLCVAICELSKQYV